MVADDDSFIIVRDDDIGDIFHLWRYVPNLSLTFSWKDV